MSFDQRAVDSQDAGSAAPAAHGTPGKGATTSALPAVAGDGAGLGVDGGAGGAGYSFYPDFGGGGGDGDGARGAGEDPFAVHLGGVAGGGRIARKSAGAGEAGAGAAALVADAATDGGEALPATTRGAAVRSLGVDLSSVRVHTGAAAEHAADAISAQAYTTGADIYFGAGRYQPGSADGDHLIAHELVHVAQQAGAPAAPQRQALEVTDRAEPAEREAERGADAILAGQAFAVQERPSGVARVENLSGNPAERGSAGGGTPTTTHRTPGIGDTANAPATGPAPAAVSRAANVQVKAPPERPLHFAGAVCPNPDALYEEGAQVSPPPSGFTAVTGFRGTTDAPMVEQAADPAIYIDNQPTADDVQQGGIGDCYFEATLMGMAARDPGRIKSMAVGDGRGGATITLWRRTAHSRSIWEHITNSGPQYDYHQVAVAVSADLAVNVSNNRIHGAQLRCAPNPKATDYWAAVNGTTLEVHRKDLFECGRWAPLMEKAYARFAQQHGQYGGATPASWGAAAGTPGYDAINSGVAMYAMHVLYGPDADAAGAVQHQDLTAVAPAGSNILAANAGAVDQLLTLVGRGESAAPGDTNAPILIANTYPDAQVTNLRAAITAAMADPDWASLGADRQTKITAIQTAITAWAALPADPAGTTGGPKATALQAIGNACVEAARTPNTEHLSQLRSHIPHPIEFDTGQDAVRAADAPRLGFLGQWLEYVISAGTLVPFVVNTVGHASSEGSEPDNQALSERRATSAEASIKNGRDAAKMARHTWNTSGVGETGAAPTQAWRRVDITIDPGPANELFADARSPAIRAMMDLILNVRNLGTDNSTGQRNVYAGHAYSVVGVAFVTATGIAVPLAAVPAASRAALFPLVDTGQSTVRLRNPHHGNEPDRTGSNVPTRPGDGAPSGPSADGTFTMSVDEFFRNFNSLQSGVFPRT